MNRSYLAAFAALAVVALPLSGALADRINPVGASGKPVDVAVRGAWKDGTPFLATVEDNGEAIRLLISEDNNPIVDNQAISSYTPTEGASYWLRTEADGTLVLDIQEPYESDSLFRQTISMRADVADVQVVAYDLTMGVEGEVPDFHCKLDLVAGTALIESAGNVIESSFSGAPADQTAAYIWSDTTAADIGGCINPG